MTIARKKDGDKKMTITEKRDGDTLTVAIEGRMDANSASQLDEALKAEYETINDLTIDLEKLAYISSAGLRVLLSAQKTMNKKGSMVIRNVPPDVMEIFDMVGFSDLLNIEE